MDESMQHIPLYCRLCTNQLAMSENLFGYSHNGVPLIYMLEYCLKHRFSRNVALPQFVCSACVHQIINVYSFHLACISSEQHFVNVLNEQTRFVEAEQANFMPTEPVTFEQTESLNFIPNAPANYPHAEQRTINNICVADVEIQQPIEQRPSDHSYLVGFDQSDESVRNVLPAVPQFVQAVQPAIVLNEVANFEQPTNALNNDNIGIATMDSSTQTFTNALDEVTSNHLIHNIPDQMMHFYHHMKPPMMYKSLNKNEDELEMRDRRPPSLLAIGAYDPSLTAETYENLDDISTPTVLFHLHASDDHEEIRIYECFDCKRFFVELEELRQHIPTHNKDIEKVKQLQPFVLQETIPDCEISKSDEELELSNEKPQTPMTMTMTSYEPSNIAKLAPNNDDVSTPTVLLHSYTDSDEEKENAVYQCFDCKHCFVRLEELRRHVPAHNPKRYVCLICDIHFKHPGTLIRHRYKHASYKCQYCPMTGAFVKEVDKHILKQHKNILEYFYCNICPRKFLQPYLLEFHLAIHAENNDREKSPVEFKCDKCDKRFQNQGRLNKHNNSKHMAHLCSECGKTFKNIYLLRNHATIHSSEKPFKCSQCPSRFKQRSALNRHMLVHSDQRNYVCDICGAKFAIKDALNCHKRIHSDVRKYSCDACPMRFHSSTHFKRHMKTHTGEKPYKCEHCNRAFGQKNDMLRHTQIHIGTIVHTCNVCSETFRLKSELQKHSYSHSNN